MITRLIYVLCSLALAGCIAQRERSESDEAADYKIQQHYSVQCAEDGLLPGSAPFNDCVTRLENAPVSTTPASNR